MEITFKVSDGLSWVRWRSRAGHIEDGHFVVDDEPGERTGPWGKTHAASGDGRTVCGKSVEPECEVVPEDEVSADDLPTVPQVGQPVSCPICSLRGTSWPPLSWLLRWHLRRMARE